MTVTTKKKPKTANKEKTKGLPPLPPSADVIEISGRDYIIAPLDEYTQWCEDQALRPLVDERLKHLQEAVSFGEIEARLGQRKKGR